MNFKNITSNFDWTLVGLITILVITETVAQIFLERGALELKKEHKKYLFIGVGVLLYSFVGYFYYLALESKISLAIVNIIWQTMTIILISFVSMFIFKQPLSNKQIVGIIIVIIGSIFVVPEKQNI